MPSGEESVKGFRPTSDTVYLSLCSPPLECLGAPAKGVHDVTSSFSHGPSIGERQAVPSNMAREGVQSLAKLVLLVVPSPIIRLRIAAVLVARDIGDPNSKVRVWKPGLPGAVVGDTRVREAAVHDDDCDDGQDKAEAESVEAVESVQRSYDPLQATIEEDAVLSRKAIDDGWMGQLTTLLTLFFWRRPAPLILNTLHGCEALGLAEILLAVGTRVHIGLTLSVGDPAAPDVSEDIVAEEGVLVGFAGNHVRLTCGCVLCDHARLLAFAVDGGH